jgi:hypothetical protein
MFHPFYSVWSQAGKKSVFPNEEVCVGCFGVRSDFANLQNGAGLLLEQIPTAHDV